MQIEEIDVCNDKEFQRLLHDNPDRPWGMIISLIHKIYQSLIRLDEYSNAHNPPYIGGTIVFWCQCSSERAFGGNWH